MSFHRLDEDRKPIRKGGKKKPLRNRQGLYLYEFRQTGGGRKREWLAGDREAAQLEIDLSGADSPSSVTWSSGLRRFLDSKTNLSESHVVEVDRSIRFTVRISALA